MNKYQFHNNKFSARFRKDLRKIVPQSNFQEPIAKLVEVLKKEKDKKKKSYHSPFVMESIMGDGFTASQLHHMCSTANYISIKFGVDMCYACLLPFDVVAQKDMSGTQRIIRQCKPSNIGRFIWTNGCREHLISLLGEEAIGTSTSRRKLPSTIEFERRVVKIGSVNGNLGKTFDLMDHLPHGQRKPNMAASIHRANLEMFNNGIPRAFMHSKYVNKNASKKGGQYTLVSLPNELTSLLDAMPDTKDVKRALDSYATRSLNGKLPIVLRKQVQTTSIKEATAVVPVHKELASNEVSAADILTTNRVLRHAGHTMDGVIEMLELLLMKKIHENDSNLFDVVDEKAIAALK